MKLRHRETGIETEIAAGLEVGRLAGCGLVVDDGSVSRHHARVEQRGGEWWLVDLGSSNGSKRNGRKEAEFPLRNGDLVTIGAVAFDVVGAPAAAPAEAVPGPPDPSSGAASATVAPSSSSPTAAPRGATLLEEEPDDLGLAQAVQETAAERARIHAELRSKRRASGFGDLGQLPLRMQLLVALIGIAFLVGVVYGVRWLGESM